MMLAIVYARNPVTGRRVIAHRTEAEERGFAVIVDWEKSGTVYRGQPKCDLCGEFFIPKEAAVPLWQR